MRASDQQPVVCLMGPTASGKTDVAIRLAERLPLDVVSVDSAMVYRGMDIGTAKPDPETLERVPHRLLDIRDPEESYSAGQFVRDAAQEIRAIHAAGRVPLLAGGTMMYFRALTRGIAALPAADSATRAAIDAEAARRGWPAMHAELAAVDPEAAERIAANDSQRIQRALEVWRLSGKPLSAWHREAGAEPRARLRFVKLALVPGRRRELHRRIERRLDAMLEAGFMDEVRDLCRRPGLSRESPSMRAVGYRQMWACLDGDYGPDEARERAIAATRQLAKRQLTWLRADPDLIVSDPLETGYFGSILSTVEREMAQY